MYKKTVIPLQCPENDVYNYKYYNMQLSSNKCWSDFSLRIKSVGQGYKNMSARSMYTLISTLQCTVIWIELIMNEYCNLVVFKQSVRVSQGTNCLLDEMTSRGATERDSGSVRKPVFADHYQTTMRCGITQSLRNVYSHCQSHKQHTR